MKAEQLRKAILQMAIQGKLVPQDPNDEPASVLLERIRAEKQKLIKEGKIKKDKTDSIIFKGDDNCHYEKIGNEVRNIEDEVSDFDLPEGWAFARISSLFYIQTGASFKKEQATNDITQTRVLRGGNILQGEYRFLDNDIFINPKLVSDSILLQRNDLITPAVTSIENIGKLALVEHNYNNVTAGGFVFIIRPYCSSTIFAKYMLYALQSSYFNKQLRSITKKSGQAFYNLGKERLIQLIIPIPPLKEQSLIVYEIEKYLPFLKEYDRLEQQKTKIDSEIYDKLKKSILQYAIQGKLVPQDPSDEPASVLLERIRAEKKTKLGKKYVESYIYKGDDNCYYEHIGGKDIDITESIPFDLPNGWVWSRLDNLALYKKGPFGSSLTKDMFVPKSTSS
ncbi:MAG: restriction endonuclease subunit S, partial [Clostridia bacterium]|nr:restriction endonuclease subunit S [Clostridia bacterium]